MSSTEQCTGTKDYQATIRVKASPEAVFDELMVGNRGRPRYRTVDSQSQTAPPR